MSFDPTTIKQLEAVLDRYTTDPYNSVPRVVVAAANAEGVILNARSGYEHVPADPKDLVEQGVRVKDESVFELFSCTKLVATIAALQLVEQGRLDLKAEAGQYLESLRDMKLLKGWEEGKPILVEPKRKVTVEMLVTHTSGFTYYWHEDHKKYMEYAGIEPYVGPNDKNATREHLTGIPLMYEPGEHWTYGTSIDWLTLVVEAVSDQSIEDYFQQHIFKPLGITDISYIPNPNKISMAYSPAPYKFGPGANVDHPYHSGGSGLQGSATSYLRILQAILRGGELGGARILKPETVELMFQSHLDEDEGHRKRQLKDLTEFSNMSDPFHAHKKGQEEGNVDWGYGGLITGLNEESYSHGRKKGTLSWSGFANTFWTIDRASDLVTVVFFNVIPYANVPAFECWEEVETLLYKGAGKA